MSEIKKSLVDMVICVHNALEDIKACIDSIYSKTELDFNLIIVNDNSDRPTTDYLRKLKKDKSNFLLVENSSSLGYTKSANIGLKRTKSEIIVLLNSDVVVSSGWLNQMIECANSSSKIGLVGPLSNAATWQSVPEIFDYKGDWVINLLPSDMHIDEYAALVKKVSTKIYPRIELLNGFCILIKREVIDAIGYLDESSFPMGYGEENEYCFRAKDFGFELVIDDATYLYHAKSKSFGHSARIKYAEAGASKLLQKFGNDRIKWSTDHLRNHQYLREIRQCLKKELSKKKLNNLHRDRKSMNVLFLLPIAGTAGGIHSIFQEVSGMRQIGVNAKIATRESNRYAYQNIYDNIKNSDEYFFFYYDLNTLITYAGQYDVVVATIHSSILLLGAIYANNPNIVHAYYIQDYEPFFFEKDTEDWKLAFDSYKFIPDALLFAKTDWLCRIIKNEHEVEVKKVLPSLDTEIFHPNFCNNDSDYLNITAMVRPSTPRRGAERTMRVLKQIKEKYKEKIRINIFGTPEENLNNYDIETDFIYTNHQILRREKVAELLQKSDIFLDFSVYQAFGRTGLEAMASGCAVVLPAKGGTHEYAVDKINSLLVDTSDDKDCLQALQSLIENPSFRKVLIKNGILRASQYSIHRAAVSELQLFSEIIVAKKKMKKLNEFQLFTESKRFLIDENKILYDLVSMIIIVDSDTTQEDINKIQKLLREGDELILVINYEGNFESKIPTKLNSNYNIVVVPFKGIQNVAESYNRGIKSSSNPFICLFSKDIKVENDFLSKITSHFSNSNIGAVAPLTNNENSFQFIGSFEKDFPPIENVAQVNQLISQKNLGMSHVTCMMNMQPIIFKKAFFNRFGEISQYNNWFFSELEFIWKLRRNSISIGIALDVYAYNDKQTIFLEDLMDDSRELFCNLQKYYGNDNVPDPIKIWGIKNLKFDNAEFNENTDVNSSQIDLVESPISQKHEYGGSKISIILLTHNELKFTKECIDSIIKYTDIYYELIIVDNNSSDGTQEYIEELSNQNQNFKIILNEKNKGFPAAVNQGILQSNGDYIVIANNDIIVTKNWLGRMLEIIESDEKIGIVGPVSNTVSGVQLDNKAKYKTITEMHEYAEKTRETNHGKIIKFPRIAFLCTLIKKQVIEKIGGLDERFTPGNFEDDDFCLRSQLAGYVTVIAEDIFVHHYGSVSFKKQGEKKYAEQLNVNEQKFIQKWGSNPEGIWIQGEKLIERSINFPINKDNFIQYFERAMRNIDDDEYEFALNNLKLAAEHFNDSTRMGYERITQDELFNIAGNIALSKNMLEEAKILFEEELKKNPKSTGACLGLGEIFYIAEMYDEAKTMLEWAIANDSDNKNAKIRLKDVNIKLEFPQEHNSLLGNYSFENNNYV